MTEALTRRRIIARSEPVEPVEPEEPEPELEPKPEPEPYHHHPHPHPHHQHQHQHHYDLSMAYSQTTTAAAAAVMAAHPLDLDQPLHSFAPSIRAHSQSDLLDPLLAAHHHPASASTSSPSPSSFASSTNTNAHTNTDGGEHDTSPSSAPSLLNDTSSSLPQTPQTPSSSSANSHFRLDLHSTDFSAVLKQQQQHQQHQQRQQHPLYYPNPTNDDGLFALFLAQRSPVLKACELYLLGLQIVPDSILASQSSS